MTLTNSVSILSIRAHLGLRIDSFLFLLSICLLAPVKVGAQDKWLPLGLSEHVSAIAVDPTDPNVIYVGTYRNASLGISGKLFKSIDGGQTWDTLAIGLSVNKIEIHPVLPSTLYIANTPPVSVLLKSIDAGETLFRADSGIVLDGETGVISLSMDLDHPETLYCGTDGLWGGTIYKTTNGGNSWNSLHCDSLPPPPIACAYLRSGIRDITLDRGFPGTVYVAIRHEAYSVKTIDGGEFWSFMETANFSEFLVDPSVPGLIYAGSSGFGVFRTTDYGVTWSESGVGLLDSMLVFSLWANPSQPGEIWCVGRSRSGLNLDAFRSFNYGATWTSTNYPSSADVIVGSSMNGRVYAGGLGGLYYYEIGTGIRQEENLESLLNVNVFPNPLNGQSRVDFNLKTSGFVEISLYNVLGQSIQTVLARDLDAGRQTVHIRSLPQASGIYWLKVKTLDVVVAKKIIVLK